ncbi:hypothetical protein [Lutibacter citreus]|uniref:hypothetical protein n=1 Tax=Lutibacter citreus TaxID=2138210 RepID=UPI000DBE61A8|nr:hypothetical protein [Lutibacter citreus]
MKKILLLTIILFSSGAFACDCDPPKITEKYIESDFVANITIVKIYPNKENELGYKADIKINELYKGNVLKSIYIYGRSDNGFGTSCDIFIPVKTKLIAYARKNKDGNYGIGMCSGIMYLNYSQFFKKKTLKGKRELEKENRELEILNTLKSKNIQYVNKIRYQEKSNLYKDLENFKGVKLNKRFGLYEINFSNNFNIKSISTVSGFENEIDNKLISILSKTKWTSYESGKEIIIPHETKLLIGIYYYGNGNQSFLTQQYL